MMMQPAAVTLPVRGLLLWIALAVNVILALINYVRMRQWRRDVKWLLSRIEEAERLHRLATTELALVQEYDRQKQRGGTTRPRPLYDDAFLDS